MKLRIASLTILTAAAVGGIAFAADSYCGFCDNINLDYCFLDSGHEFWAIHNTHSEAHEGFHEAPDCGNCSGHKKCGNNMAAAEIQQAMDGERPLQETMSAHAKQLALREDASALDIKDCAGHGTAYTFRLTAPQMEIARAVIDPGPALSD
jgi:hypothetical protein